MQLELQIYLFHMRNAYGLSVTVVAAESYDDAIAMAATEEGYSVEEYLSFGVKHQILTATEKAVLLSK
jgi:hypothetical protein